MVACEIFPIWGWRSAYMMSSGTECAVFAIALRKHLEYLSALALVLFAFFFASTNLFTHVHEGPEGRIVHSHPWSGKSHSHSDTELQLLQLISSNIFEASERITVTVSDRPVVPYHPSGALPEVARTVFHHVLGLRAPPQSL